MSGLAVVVVTYQSRERVLLTLDDLLAVPERRGWEIVVIDNASSDGTIAAIAAAHPGIATIRNEIGRGFAAAVNQGIAATRAAAVAVVPAGTRIPPGTLPRLRGVLEGAPDIAAVAPLVRHLDGTVQRHGLFRPRPRTALVILFGLARLPFFAREAERYYGRHVPGPPSDVEQVSGACMVLRRAALEAIGGFDERFYLYCEDVDWCLRATTAGWRIVFAPEVEVRREKSASSRGSGARVIRLYYRSLRQFYAKHHASGSVVAGGVWMSLAHLAEWWALAVNALSSEKRLRY